MGKKEKVFKVDPKRAHREKHQANKLPPLTEAERCARAARQQRRMHRPVTSSSCGGCQENPVLDSNTSGLDVLFAIERDTPARDSDVAKEKKEGS